MAILKPGQLASGSYTISGSFSGSFQGSGAGLNNIPSSAIVGLSSTQIASGAVTASVSPGTGSFTVTSGSSTFMFISSSGNVGIGTSTPAFGLDVNGTARFSGLTTISNDSGLRFLSGTNPNNFVGIGWSIVDGTERASLRINWQTGEIRFGNTTGGGYFPTFYSNQFERMRIFGTGNIGIGTTTDAGYRLDVNGTARISGQLTVGPNPGNFLQTGGSTAVWFSDASNPLRITLIQSLINLNNAGDFTIHRTMSSARGVISTNPETFNLAVEGYSRVDGIFNRNLFNVNKSIFYASTNGGGSVTNAPILRYFHAVKGNVTGYTNYRGIEIEDLDSFFGTTSGSVGIGANTSINASAILDVTSTTKGFLPPRTNLTSNISTPAQGLITYLTGSTNEGLYYYNSGSAVGWHKVLTNSGSQDISGSLNLTGFATGSVLFTSGSAGTITRSANLFWDNTNARLGIGTDTPTSYTGWNSIDVRGTNGGQVIVSNTALTRIGEIFIDANGMNLSARTANALLFKTSDVERMRFTSGGNVLINTTTDAGFKLDVNGTARFSSSSVIVGTFSSTSLNARISINSTTAIPNAGFALSANNILKWSLASYGATSDFTFYNEALVADALFIKGSTNNVVIGGNTDAGFKLDVNGTARVQNTTTITKGGANYITLEASANTVAPYIQLFYQGVRDVRISAASNGFNFTEAGFVNPTQINAGNIIANGGFTSAPSTGQSFVSLNGANGSTSAIYFREAGVAFRGALGFAGGSSDFTILQNLTGQTNFAGNERLRIFGATGNVGINTTTDAGFKLDVSGSGRFSGNLTVTGSASNSLLVRGSGTTTATNTFQIQNANTSASLVVNDAGNTLLGTTTDAGFRLDINGTARVRDVGSELSITSPLSAIAPVIFSTRGASGGYRGGYNFRGGFGGTVGNTIFIIDTGNTDATSRAGIGNFAFSDLASAKFSIDNTQSGGRNAAIRLRANFANNSTEYNGIDFNAYTGTDIGGFIGSQRNTATSGFGADIVVLATLDSGPSTYLEIARFMGRYNSFYVGTDRTLAVPSAKMQVESTTQGFLPPRMTTTQKNAIASPTAGLQVFDTTLNQMSYYNGTTWINF